MKTQFFFIPFILIPLLLAGCGGGGGDSSTQTYNVTTDAGTGGSISPTSASVNEGDTTSFTVTPDTGYTIDSVSGCDGSLSGNSYTTGAVTTDCAVSATFSVTVVQYSVTTDAGTGGSISPASASVNEGDTTSFTVTPDTNYAIDSVSGCNGSLSGNIYTTGMVTADCVVSASFEGPPAAPNLTLSYSNVKTFSFSWGDVADETEYRLLENPDGVSGYSQVASLAADVISYDQQVFLPVRINANYILQACNSNGCSDSAPVMVSGTLTGAVGYVKASNSGAGDEFGYSLALSGDGNTLAVGASWEGSDAVGIGGDDTNNEKINAGAVYVFTRNGSVWSQQAYVKASNTNAGDRFGYSLSLSDDGNTLAVGAIWENSAATGIDGNEGSNAATNAGAVYVFTRTGSDWSQQAYVKASNTDPEDRFGSSLALSSDGNTLAVGAFEEYSAATGIGANQNDNSLGGAGAVYIFTRDALDVWSQQIYVKASTIDAGDSFGRSLTLSGDGNTLAVGVYGEDSAAIGIDGNQSDNTANKAGAVYVFTYNGSVWSQQAYVKASNTDAEDRFGSSLALSSDGDTLAVGAYQEDSAATGIGGDQNDNAAIDSGAVYVFTRTGSVWTQQAYVKASNTNWSDSFGYSLALSGDGSMLAVGAKTEDSAATGIDGNQSDNAADIAGAVYVFTRSGTDWSQQAYVKASNTDGFDEFGVSLALSTDGNTLAVGAYAEDSAATGIGGDQNDNMTSKAGAVYLY